MTMTRRMVHRGVTLPLSLLRIRLREPERQTERVEDRRRRLGHALRHDRRGLARGVLPKPVHRRPDQSPAEHRQAILLCFRADAFIGRKETAGNECHQFIEKTPMLPRR